MRIISRSTLKQYVQSRVGHKDHAAVRSAIDAWFAEVSKANWRNMADVKQLYATASVVTAERIVFNIKGNNYRLIVSIDYEKEIIYIKYILTHAEYDKEQWKNDSYF